MIQGNPTQHGNPRVKWGELKEPALNNLYRCRQCLSCGSCFVTMYPSRQNPAFAGSLCWGTCWICWTDYIFEDGDQIRLEMQQEADLPMGQITTTPEPTDHD